MSLVSIPSAVVTGGAGFVGAGIVRMLQSRHPECEITVLDLNIPAPDASNHRFCPGVIYKQMDMTDRASVAETLSNIKPTLVIHTAGVIPTVSLLLQKNSKRPDVFKLVNLEGTQNVLDASITAGVKAFVYTSSADVVKGNSWANHNGLNEDAPYPKLWDNPYAQSKVRGPAVI